MNKVYDLSLQRIETPQTRKGWWPVPSLPSETGLMDHHFTQWNHLPLILTSIFTEVGIHLTKPISELVRVRVTQSLSCGRYYPKGPMRITDTGSNPALILHNPPTVWKQLFQAWSKSATVESWELFSWVWVEELYHMIWRQFLTFQLSDARNWFIWMFKHVYGQTYIKNEYTHQTNKIWPLQSLYRKMLAVFMQVRAK